MTMTPPPNPRQRAATIRQGLVTARRRKYEEMRLIDSALSQLATSLREARGLEATLRALAAAEAALKSLC